MHTYIHIVIWTHTGEQTYSHVYIHAEICARRKELWTGLRLINNDMRKSIWLYGITVFPFRCCQGAKWGKDGESESNNFKQLIEGWLLVRNVRMYHWKKNVIWLKFQVFKHNPVMGKVLRLLMLRWLCEIICEHYPLELVWSIVRWKREEDITLVTTIFVTLMTNWFLFL